MNKEEKQPKAMPLAKNNMPGVGAKAEMTIGLHSIVSCFWMTKSTSFHSIRTIPVSSA